MRKKKTRNAVAFVRRSNSGQHGSFDRQISVITEYAKKHKLHIVEWFKETSSGGAPLAVRGVFRAALRRCLCDDVSFLLMEDADRFARDADLAWRLRFILRSARVEVIDHILCGETPSTGELLSELKKRRTQR